MGAEELITCISTVVVEVINLLTHIIEQNHPSIDVVHKLPLSKENLNDCLVLDLTDPSFPLSPYHIFDQGIPVPYFPKSRAFSVSSIWESLKVFEKIGIDCDSLRSRERVKRQDGPVQGRLLGWSRGLETPPHLFNETEAINRLFTPAYRHTLNTYCKPLLNKIKKTDCHKIIIVDDRGELSSGSFLKTYLEKLFTEDSTKAPKIPKIPKEIKKKEASNR